MDSQRAYLVITQNMLNLLENQGLGTPADCLFLLKLRFLIFNRRQFGMIGKTNSQNSRDPVSNLVPVIQDSISKGPFSHLLNEIIELDWWFLNAYM